MDTRTWQRRNQHCGKTFETRFWEKVQAAVPGQCWLWTASTGTHGYGHIMRGGKLLLAHRIAYALAHGCEIHPGMVIRHLCNNPLCCNPEHLAPGTPADNVADKVKAGRQPHKLTQYEVLQIKKLLQQGQAQREIAAWFGVAQNTIKDINTGKTWSWL